MSGLYNPAISRSGALKSFRQRLDHLSIDSDSDFRELIEACRGLLEFSERDLADKLNVSRPTINRWVSGKNLPHRALRRVIVEWAKDEVSRRVRDLATFGSSAGYGMAASAQ